MGYYIDLKMVSIDLFIHKLKSTRLLPSQKILSEKMDKRFRCLKTHGIKNLDDLSKTLKTKDHVQSFAETSQLPVEFLTVLRREVNSYHPRVRKIKDFSCINKVLKDKLEAQSIKNTKQLFDYILTRKRRKEFVEMLSISNEDALLLAKLADVSRLRYVNEAFATLLMNTRYDTVGKIQLADYEELYEELTEVNAKHGFYKGNISQKDMAFRVEDSKFFPLVVAY